MPAPTRVSRQNYVNRTLALPAAATAQTPWIPVRGGGVSITVAWSGTPTGTFSLVSSDDGGVTSRAPSGSVAEFTNSPNAQPAGASGGAQWNFSEVPAGLIAILYTATSGTGTLTYRITWRG